MTISNDTAKEAAKRIYDRINEIRKSLPDYFGFDPLFITLSLVEDMMTIPGNKSYQESMQLLHRAIKDYHLNLKIEASDRVIDEQAAEALKKEG